MSQREGAGIQPSPSKATHSVSSLPEGWFSLTRSINPVESAVGLDDLPTITASNFAIGANFGHVRGVSAVEGFIDVRRPRRARS
ncbi:hypothetical protein [Leucobacter alluvii]|uniref:hypothetical protein n=1 Tax=Leucobacter alluvii TaxID=340321 RepID=UPI0031F9D03B